MRTWGRLLWLKRAVPLLSLFRVSFHAAARKKGVEERKEHFQIIQGAKTLCQNCLLA